jgi:DNA-binding MarR family transcriptional regulator
MKASELPRAVTALLVEFLMGHKKRFQAIAAEAGFQPPQVGMMMHLRDYPDGMAMNALAAECGCDPSNITGLVDKLEERGMVRRETAPNDRRVKLIVLTNDGRAFMKEVFNKLHEPPDWMLKLPQSDLRAMHDALRRGLHPEDE